MNSKKVFYALSGLIILFIVLAIFGAYEINGLLQKKANSLTSTKAKNQSLQNEQTELAKSKRDIVKYQSLYQISQSVVPQSKDQTQAVRQITDLAAKSGVTIQSISFPASTLGSAPGGAGAATTTPVPGQGVPAAGNNPSLSQLLKVPSIPGVYELQITVKSSSDPNHLATFQELINYLQALEQNRLTAQVSSLVIQPIASTTNQSQINMQFSLVLNVYINPSAKG